MKPTALRSPSQYPTGPCDWFCLGPVSSNTASHGNRAQRLKARRTFTHTKTLLDAIVLSDKHNSSQSPGHHALQQATAWCQYSQDLRNVPRCWIKKNSFFLKKTFLLQIRRVVQNVLSTKIETSDFKLI